MSKESSGVVAPRDFNAELARLDADHQAGLVTDAQYELIKTQIIQAATRPKRSGAVTFLIWFAVAVAAFILWRIWAVIVNSLSGIG
jgi:hypothetical protein